MFRCATKAESKYQNFRKSGHGRKSPWFFPPRLVSCPKRVTRSGSTQRRIFLADGLLGGLRMLVCLRLDAPLDNNRVDNDKLALLCAKRCSLRTVSLSRSLSCLASWSLHVLPPPPQRNGTKHEDSGISISRSGRRSRPRSDQKIRKIFLGVLRATSCIDSSASVKKSAQTVSPHQPRCCCFLLMGDIWLNSQNSLACTETEINLWFGMNIMIGLNFGSLSRRLISNGCLAACFQC